MDVFGAKTASAADNDFVPLFFPFEDRTRADSELSAYIDRNWNLSLRRYLWLCDSHSYILPR